MSTRPDEPRALGRLCGLCCYLSSLSTITTFRELASEQVIFLFIPSAESLLFLLFQFVSTSCFLIFIFSPKNLYVFPRSAQAVAGFLDTPQHRLFLITCFVFLLFSHSARIGSDSLVLLRSRQIQYGVFFHSTSEIDARPISGGETEPRRDGSRGERMCVTGGQPGVPVQRVLQSARGICGPVAWECDGHTKTGVQHRGGRGPTPNCQLVKSTDHQNAQRPLHAFPHEEYSYTMLAPKTRGRSSTVAG
jgi:hypothetical protein